MGVGDAGVNRGVFGSDGLEGSSSGGVRPVVSLKSDVTTDTIPKIADQEEQDWSGFLGGGSPQ